MISPSQIVKLKRSAIACMAIALAITSSMLFMKTSPRQDNSVTQSRSSIDNREISTATSDQTAAVNNHHVSVAVIMLNNDKEMLLAIRVGDKNIEIPGPSSWPNDSKTGPENGRFLAGIIDTADVLKANGFKPDETYSFVVGGTALNASNTFRVTGNHQADLARNNTGDYTEEYHSNPDEAGIWRSLKFKNIVLSYGQIPSLADFLVTPHISPAKTPIPALNDQSPAIMGDSSIKTAEDIKKYREDLNSSYPEVRAKAIQNLMLFSNPFNKDPAHPDAGTYLEKALTDTDPTVREAALSSLDLWDGEIPMQTFSKIALNDQDPNIRMHALSILADRFDEQSVPTLQQASHDPDSRVAQKAGQLLQAFSP